MQVHQVSYHLVPKVQLGYSSLAWRSGARRTWRLAQAKQAQILKHSVYLLLTLSLSLSHVPIHQCDLRVE